MTACYTPFFKGGLGVFFPSHYLLSTFNYQLKIAKFVVEVSNNPRELS